MSPQDAQAMCESKNRYPTKKDAATAINSAMRRRRKRPAALRSYPCPICKGWHLTHKEK